MKLSKALPVWSLAAPVAGLALLGGSLLGLGGWYTLFMAAGLMASVLAAVHHAEVVAHRVGEPYGTLVLAVAVTVIEVALIVSLMLSGGEATAALARDTVFAAVMIILNGMLGLCLLVGAQRHGEQSFTQHGVSASLATLAAIVTLTLVLPNYTTTGPGRCTARASWPLSPWCRWCCMAPLCWCRPCATATIFCRPTPLPSQRAMPRHPAATPRCWPAAC